MTVEQFWPWEPFPRGVREHLIAVDPETGDEEVEWRFSASNGDVPICPGDYILTEGRRRIVVPKVEFEKR